MKHLIALSDLIQAAGLGLQGVDLYVGTIPGDVTSGVMLRPPLASTEIDEGMNGHVDETILVIVRDPDMMTSYNRAEDIAKAVSGKHIQVGDVYFSWIRQESMPVSFPRGDGDEIETSVRLQVGWALAA